MKVLKKIWSGVVALAAVSMLFMACPTPENTGDPSDNNGDTPAVTDSLKSGDEVTVNVGASIDVTVSGKTAAEFDQEGLTVTHKGNGVFTIAAAETMTDATVTVNFNDGTDEDDGIGVTVYVYDPYYHLTITLDEAVAENAATISVAYGGVTENTVSETVAASYTAGEATATARLKKEYANEWYWFSPVTVTVKDSEENEIVINQSVAYFCYTATTGDGYLENNTIAVTAGVESITLTINFEGFTVAESGSVVLKYGPSTASETATVTRVSETSYSAEILSSNKNSTGWFVIEATINNGTDDITGFSYYGVAESKNTKWFNYATGNQTVKLIVSNDVWVTLKDGIDYTAGGTLTKVLEASEFSELSIAKLKVATSGASESTGWNPSVCYETYEEESEWTNAKALSWDTSYSSGYSLEITDADFISNVKSKGLYLSAGSKYYVYYVASE